VVRQQVRRIRKFRIGPSLSKRIGIVRFESNLEPSQVPNLAVVEFHVVIEFTVNYSYESGAAMVHWFSQWCVLDSG